jgi:hypothetical protein
MMVEKSGTKKMDTLKSNKKLRVFLLFLFLSFLFWTLIKLSREYIAEVEFGLDYTDIPQNKLIQNEPSENIKLTLKTSGFKLLRYGFKQKNLEYTLTEIDRKSGSEYYSETSSNINFLQAQLSAETVVLNAEPDTLFFDLGVRKSKEVKVISNVNFEFKNGYNFVQPVKMDPETVTISGPDKVIDTINEVYTENTAFQDLSVSFTRSVVVLPPNDVVEISDNEVNVIGEVDKITDGSFTIPFEVVNLPRNYLISTYPKEVKVVFQVALKDFNKIPENSFRVQCDYKQSEENNLDYLIPQVVEKPEIIFDVKVIPNKIEFLIKK